MDIEKKQRRKHRVKDLVQKFAQSNNKQTEWCIPEEGGVLLGILGGGLPPFSPNPNPISDQNVSFSTSVSRPGL